MGNITSHQLYSRGHVVRRIRAVGNSSAVGTVASSSRGALSMTRKPKPIGAVSTPLGVAVNSRFRADFGPVYSLKCQGVTRGRFPSYGRCLFIADVGGSDCQRPFRPSWVTWGYGRSQSAAVTQMTALWERCTAAIGRLLPDDDREPFNWHGQTPSGPARAFFIRCDAGPAGRAASPGNGAHGAIRWHRGAGL